jgi:hypothetical protein
MNGMKKRKKLRSFGAGAGWLAHGIPGLAKQVRLGQLTSERDKNEEERVAKLVNLDRDRLNPALAARFLPKSKNTWFWASLPCDSSDSI